MIVLYVEKTERAIKSVLPSMDDCTISRKTGKCYEECTADCVLMQERARMTGLTRGGGRRRVTAVNGIGGDEECLLPSRRGLVQEDKRMAFVYTHGLFIT